MKALVLSGGGSKGAYQVGALQYLMRDLRRDYEIVCGVGIRVPRRHIDSCV